MGKHPMPVPGAVICRSLISQLSRRRERRIWCLSVRGAVRVFCLHVPMVIWRAPKWAGSRKPHHPLLLLSFLCVPFRFLPLLLVAGHRGLAGCPASLMPKAPDRDRSRRGPRCCWLRDGCHPQKVRRWGSWQAHSPACQLVLLQAQPTRPLPRPWLPHAHVEALPVRISLFLSAFSSSSSFFS